MPRPRMKNSKTSFGNLGLSNEEDKELMKLLEEKDITLSQLLRMQVRKWVREVKQSEIRAKHVTP
jgi:hypothetical protein